LWIYPFVATARRLSERRHCRKPFHFQVGFTLKLERLHTIGYFISPYKHISNWTIMITACRDVISQCLVNGYRNFGETKYNLLGCDIAKPSRLVWRFEETSRNYLEIKRMF
jgi:hypothetical protein